MKREEKTIIKDVLAGKSSKHFYLADISGLMQKIQCSLEEECFKEDIKLQVVKNTLIEKALEKSDKEFRVYKFLKIPLQSCSLK
jgi:large subunit ribosomal protein L10